MSQKTFTTTLQGTDRGTVRLVIPFDPSEVWGKQARHFVKGTLDGASFHTSLGKKGGVHFFPVNKELRAKANVGPGDRVRVVLEPAQEQEEELVLPAELEQALAGKKRARSFLVGLSAFQQRRFTDWIASAKRVETRQERVGKAVAFLEGGHRLP